MFYTKIVKLSQGEWIEIISVIKFEERVRAQHIVEYEGFHGHKNEKTINLLAIQENQCVVGNTRKSSLESSWLLISIKRNKLCEMKFRQINCFFFLTSLSSFWSDISKGKTAVIGLKFSMNNRLSHLTSSKRECVVRDSPRNNFGSLFLWWEPYWCKIFVVSSRQPYAWTNKCNFFLSHTLKN